MYSLVYDLAVSPPHVRRSTLAVGPPGPGESRNNNNNGDSHGNSSSDGEWEVFPPGYDDGGGGGGVGGSGTADRGEVTLTWRDRFVRNGGVDTLVELLLTRDWDVAANTAAASIERGGRGGLGEEDGTVGISLACLTLLLVLLERFIEEEYIPEPRQLGRLVREILSKIESWRLPSPEVLLKISVCSLLPQDDKLLLFFRVPCVGPVES